MLTNSFPPLATLGERIAYATRSSEAKAVVIQRLGVNAVTLKRWATGETKIPAESALGIAEATQVPIEWLMTGTISTYLPASDDNDVVWVPRLDVRASAGPGIVAASPDPDHPPEIAFRSTWLRSLGVAPQNAEFLTAEGDSMYPTIQDGDLMLADRGFGAVVNGKIYVLVVHGLVVVKRINLLAFGGLMLISDNPRYPPETIGRDEVNDLSIEARIAWYGRAI